MSEKFTIEINGPGFDNSQLVGQELIGFNFVESLDGCARFALMLETQSGRKWDGFIKNDEQPFSLRFGTGSAGTDGPRMSTLKTLRLLWSGRRLSGGAKAIYTFKGTCNGVALNLTRAKDKYWKERRISEIAEELIRDAGLQAAVGKTEGKFNLMGGNITTGKYLRNVLLPLAYSNRGSNWRFWVEDGRRVHFEPMKPTRGRVRFTNLYRDGWVKLKSPMVVKDTRFNAQLRSGKIEVLAYDPDSERVVRREVGENQGNFSYLGGGRPVERKKVSETIIINAQRNRQTSVNPQQLVQRVGETLWGQHGRTLYRLIGECEYEPGISVGQQVTVDLAGPLGVQDVNNGTWIVHSVRHYNTRGRVKTWVMLEKRWER